MSKAADQVWAGFMKLNTAEQQEVINAINAYQKAEHTERIKLNEDLKRRAGIAVGPIASGGCPCCGR